MGRKQYNLAPGRTLGETFVKCKEQTASKTLYARNTLRQKFTVNVEHQT